MQWSAPTTAVGQTAQPASVSMAGDRSDSGSRCTRFEVTVNPPKAHTQVVVGRRLIGQ